MFQVKTVLFPVDFSDACRAASDQVASMAAHFGAKLLLFHVVQMPAAWYGDAVAFNAIIDVGEVALERKRALDGLLGQRDDVAIKRILAYGDIAQAIVECARKERVDLIMMPTHGCGMFRRFLIGSVTAKVLHDADVPVWTDAHLPHPDAAEGDECIICGVDLKSDMAPAIAWASQYSQSYGFDLQLVHAAPGYDEKHGEIISPGHSVEDARTRIAELEKEAGIEARVAIKAGPVAQVLREAAVEYRARAIVIGQGSLHKAMGRLRTNTYAIVREAPCPVVRC